MFGSIVRNSIKLVKPWIYETSCISCSQPSKMLICQICEQSFLDLRLNNYCIICGEKNFKTNKKIPCYHCLENPPPWEHIFIGFSYDGLIQKLFQSFKFKADFKAAKVLSQKLNQLLQHQKINFNYYQAIIPIPIHRIRNITRGFNQSYILAKLISKSHNIPIDTQFVKRSKKTKAQTLIKGKNRAKNLKGAFLISNQIPFKSVIVIDDIMTTKSTLNEFCQSLKHQGVEKIFVITLAKAKTN